MKLIYSFFLAVLVHIAVVAQDGSHDLTFNTADIGFKNGDGPYNDGATPYPYINKIALQADGKILIGGLFLEYNGSPCKPFIRLNADGTFDTSFNLGPVVSEVQDIIIQSDGKIIIGGLINNFNGTQRKTIVRLNSDGTLDPAFNVTVGQESWVTLKAIALQPDGKIVMATSEYPNIIRVDANGVLDPTFNAAGIQGGGSISSMGLQSDGKLVIGGDFTNFGGVIANRLARLNTDGSLDTGFNTTVGANDKVKKIKVLPDNKILMIGLFSAYNNTFNPLLIKLNANGTVDGTFDPATFFYQNPTNFGVLSGIAVQPDGKVLIGGRFDRNGSVTVSNLSRLNTDGSIDYSFNNAGTDDYVYGFAVQSNTDIIIAGNFETHNNVARRRISRAFSNGNIDMSFNTGSGANASVSVTKVLPDNKILIAGAFRLYSGAVRNRITKLHPDGTIDTSFNSTSLINAGIDVFKVQPDGKIIIGGNFTTVGGVSRNRIARLNQDGSFDTSFNVGTGFSAYCTDIAIQNDGKIIVVGSFTSYNGVTCNKIARLNADGSLDATFITGTGANGAASRVALQSDGKIIVSGIFTTFNGAAIYGILRLNTDGTLDSSFSPGTGLNGNVGCMAVLSDGKILIAGNMQTYNGTNVANLFRLNPNGSRDTTFLNTGNSKVVSTFAIQPDGKIVVGGSGIYIGNVEGFLGRYNANGSWDATFFYPAPAANFFKTGVIYSLALQSDGKIITGGNFYSCNNVGRNRIARINNNAPLLGTDDYSLTAENVSVYEENDVLYVDSKDKILQSVSVYDLNGKLLYENQNVTGTKFPVEKIKHSNQVLIFKFIATDGKTLNLKSIF